MATTTFLEFWNTKEVKSIFLAGAGCPTGKTYHQNVDAEDEDYCDLSEVIYNLGGVSDGFTKTFDDLRGEIKDDSWEWDGQGKPSDPRGNSYTRIILSSS